MAGLDARDTVALYNRLVFSRLGYFAAFGEQAALLTERWAREGIDARPLLARWAAGGCFAYSMNHPKVIVLLDIARIACRRMGVAPGNPDVDPADLPDRLARGSMHPVYPDIAAALGIAPEGCFSAGFDRDRQVVFTPLEFVSHCFSRYATVPPEDLRATSGVPEAMAALGLTLRAPPPRLLGGGAVLMTHHGTLLRQGPSRGQLSHAAVQVAEWELAYLRLDCTSLPARQTAPGAEGAVIAPSADGRRAIVSRQDAFLCAEPHGGEAGFSRAATGPWEQFLPLADADLALLSRLEAADWIVQETQDVVRRHEVAIEAGPTLRLGRWRIDLARDFPVAVDNTVRVVLEGVQHSLRERVQAAAAQAVLPEPGRALGLVGAPVFVNPPMVADGADMDWMRRSAVAAQALDGAPQATQALLRRAADATAAGGLAVRFCGPEAARAAGWAQAAVRLHVLAAVAPADAVFLIPPDLQADVLAAWRALGFGDLHFRVADPGVGAPDLLWLDNAAIAELPAEALAGCRARIGAQDGARRNLVWADGIAPETAAILADDGFEAVDAANLPVVAGVALAAHAGCIVGRTGRMPLVFCQPGTLVIELCDEAGFVQDDWVLSSKLGLRHAVLPCAAVGRGVAAGFWQTGALGSTAGGFARRNRRLNRWRAKLEAGSRPPS